MHNSEHYDNTQIDLESIQSLSSMYNTDNVTTSNLTVTKNANINGNTNMNGNANIKGNADITGDANIKGNINTQNVNLSGKLKYSPVCRTVESPCIGMENNDRLVTLDRVLKMQCNEDEYLNGFAYHNCNDYRGSKIVNKCCKIG